MFGTTNFFLLNGHNSFSFVKNKNITVHQTFHNSSTQELFYLPLSEEGFQQFQVCNTLLADIQLQDEPDIWTYIWGSIVFTPSKAYDHLIGTRQVHPAFTWLWISTCRNKGKFFFWLWLKNCLNTRALLNRKNMALEDYNCVLCNHHIN